MRGLARQALVLALGAAAMVGVAGAAGDRQGDCQRHGGPGHRMQRFAMMMGGMLDSFDLNADGSITRAEIDKQLRRRFDAADKNHDGRLDPAEFAAAQPVPPNPPNDQAGSGDDSCQRMGEGARHGHRPDPARMFKRIDWNLDGFLSFEEFAAPVREMAMRLDRDGDGVITAGEMHRDRDENHWRGGAPSGEGPPPRDQ